MDQGLVSAVLRATTFAGGPSDDFPQIRRGRARVLIYIGCFVPPRFARHRVRLRWGGSGYRADFLLRRRAGESCRLTLSIENASGLNSSPIQLRSSL